MQNLMGLTLRMGDAFCAWRSCFNEPYQSFCLVLVRLLSLVLFMTTAGSLVREILPLHINQYFPLDGRPLIDVSIWMRSVVIRMIMKTLPNIRASKDISLELA